MTLRNGGNAYFYLAAGCVMGERVLEVLFLSASLVAGTASVSTMLERCAASGAVGKYKEPRWPHPANNPITADTMAILRSTAVAILLL